ncbi:MAG: IS630 family transposase [Acidobacteria bacterium]|nr:IS630 family transposase [Acidobacteriota bacterium]
MTAVKRVVEDAEAPSAVMDSMGLCRTSIYPWLRKFEEEGWEALAEKIAAGPEPKLSEKQRQQVKRWVVGKDPRQYGFEFGLWTRQIVAELIAKRMSVTLCLTAVGKLLAQLEITPQKPLRRASERDPAAVQAWVGEVYPGLRRKARKHGASIFFLDEAGLDSEPRLGRTYAMSSVRSQPPGRSGVRATRSASTRNSSRSFCASSCGAVRAQSISWSMGIRRTRRMLSRASSRRWREG